jgi:hypothetical protein
MKHFTNFKGLFLLIAFTAISLFSFGQKYTGLTAAASDGSTPTVIFDGNYGSRWQDASNLDNASFVVNLGSIKNVNSIKIYWEGANAKDYKLSFSTDNVNFTGELSYNGLVTGARTDLINGLNVDCQYIKFQGVTRQLPYGYSIYEFEVYPAVTPVLTSLAITPATSTIILGATKQLAVAGLDQLGNGFTLTGTTIWSVDGTGASVDATGLFSSTKKGLFTVTASNSGINKTTTIDVLPTNPNLSIGKIATASSGTASQAIDNNTGTRWESAFTDPQWIMIDLGVKKNISDIIISWEGANAKDYSIETSINGTDWTTLVTNIGMAANARTDRMYDFNVDAQYVRLTGTARNLIYGYSIWEFQIYGTTSLGTALSTPSANNMISVYPNPATNAINFSCELTKAEFYTLQGQLVQSVYNKKSVDVSAFSKGLYLVRMTDKTGVQNSSKLEIR